MGETRLQVNLSRIAWRLVFRKRFLTTSASYKLSIEDLHGKSCCAQRPLTAEPIFAQVQLFDIFTIAQRFRDVSCRVQEESTSKPRLA